MKVLGVQTVEGFTSGLYGGLFGKLACLAACIIQNVLKTKIVQNSCVSLSLVWGSEKTSFGLFFMVMDKSGASVTDVQCIRSERAAMWCSYVLRVSYFRYIG